MKKNCFATEIEGKIVHFMAVFGRHAEIKPTLSTELVCSDCKGKEHYAPYKFASEYPGQVVDNRRVWICGNPLCPTMELKNIPSTYDPKKYEKKH
jgi:hypothetical protein